MVVFFAELRRGYKGFLIWTASIAFMLAVCVLLFPEMKGQMEGVSEMFANMGGFTQAFGMDRLSFGTLIGFYGVECGNVLGIGGGFFAAFLGIGMLSKEEHEHTAEFLLTHPIRRSFVVLQKLLAVIVQILVMNLIIFGISLLSILIIGEELPLKELALLHGAYLFLELEISLVCFGISALLRRNSIGLGLGLAALLYFMNLLCNISKDAEFLKYVTPFSYAEPADLLERMSFDTPLLLLGALYAVFFTILAFVFYRKKDIAA